MVQRSGAFGLGAVFALMAVTLYMAFAFPYTLMQLKQSETTEIKSVIIVGRNGERSPTSDAYFVGEEPAEELQHFGRDQLTNVGKERMYLLGKFLKLRYYSLLLNGNPRKISARSADSDRCLESSQALLAGLNPPKDSWIWSTTSELLGWQPKAVHTTSGPEDDLLSSDSDCLRFDKDKTRWKNSTRYNQLLNEFRHDLQTLRQNTGLEFEDDLEMATAIEDSLYTRVSFKSSDKPTWYTETYASRLAHIADVSTGSRFADPAIQRLYVGRLMHEIVENINNRIRLNKQQVALEQSASANTTTRPNDGAQAAPASAPVSPKAHTEPTMFIYMTDKHHLSALLNSLQIYSSQPSFGSLLIIELHHDPVNQIYFLRLFTVSSTSPNVFPEPVRVNPIACVDSNECEPQQFEQNIRHLMLDRSSWQTLCLDRSAAFSSTPPTPTRPAPTGATDSPATTSGQPIDSSAGQPGAEPTVSPAPAASSPSSLDELEEKLIVGPTEAKPGQVVPPIPEEATSAAQTTRTEESPTSPVTTESSRETPSTLDETSSSVVVEDGLGAKPLKLTRDIYYPENQIEQM